jgi:hypothetical protein
MDLKQFLIDNPLINQAELSRTMWPDKNATNIRLANKLANRKGQRITPADEVLALDALRKLGVNISNLV